MLEQIGRVGLHDLHPTGGLVNGEPPLLEDCLELVPVDDIKSVVVSLGELDSLGSLDLSGLESFLFRNNLSLENSIFSIAMFFPLNRFRDIYLIHMYNI